MNLKSQAIEKLNQIDFINDEILSLKNKEQIIRQEISQIKIKIETENQHLIGKKALCSNISDKLFQNIECVCSAVKCTDFYDVKPLFSINGKKVLVDFYEWL
jgi:hypothetical protein